MPAIPRKFTLPGGYRVKVALVSYERMQRLALEDSSVQPDDRVQAFYDDQGGKGTLYLLEDKHPLLQAVDFAHEIKHAMAEWEDWFFRQHGVEEALENAAERGHIRAEQPGTTGTVHPAADSDVQAPQAVGVGGQESCPRSGESVCPGHETLEEGDRLHAGTAWRAGDDSGGARH